MQVWADNVRFTMSTPNVVSTNEQFRLTLALNEQGENIKLPEMSDFDVLMGPSTSTSYNFQSINGKTVQSRNFSYTFVLRAKKEGKFTIRPASIEVDGKVYQSNSINIEVVKGSAKKSNTQRNNTTQQSSQNIEKNDLFAKIHLSKSSVYKGEHLVATFKVYTKVQLSGFDDVKFPSFEGFWTQDIDIPKNIQLTREAYNGQIYNVGILKKMVLFPQQTGKIKIDPLRLECRIVQRTRAGSVFDDFFATPRTVKAIATSNPVTIDVKPLPAEPQEFSGAVGSFKITSSIDKTEVKANDAITLKTTISGNGNLKLIDPLTIGFPVDFEVYDPKTSSSVRTTEKGTTGSITHEYLFQPRHAGEYTIPAVVFVYFDPAQGKYITRKTQSYTLTVEKSDDPQGTTVVSSFSKEDVRFIGKDIRYIKQGKTNLRKTNYTFFGTLEFFLIYLIAIVVLGIIYLLNQKRVKDNANLALVRNRRASKLARKHLKKASGYLKSNNNEAFYDAVLKAFWGYLSDKLNLTVADLNRETAVASLKGNNVKEELINEFIDIVDTCEFARFAPSAEHAQMSSWFKKAESVMNKIDRQIRKS